MLAIARALMSEPRLLLLDEPSLGLAPIVIQDIFKAIAPLRESGLTILLVEQMANRRSRSPIGPTSSRPVTSPWKARAEFLNDPQGQGRLSRHALTIHPVHSRRTT